VSSTYEKVAPVAVVTPNRRPPLSLSHSVSACPSPSTSMVARVTAPAGVATPGVDGQPGVGGIAVFVGEVEAGEWGVALEGVPRGAHPASAHAITDVARIPVRRAVLRITPRYPGTPVHDSAVPRNPLRPGVVSSALVVLEMQINRRRDHEF
jgi:hypothetical protein